MFHFYTPWNRQKKGLLTFLGGVEIEHWIEIEMD